MNFIEIKNEAKISLETCRWNFFFVIFVAALVSSITTPIGIGFVSPPLIMVGLYYVSRNILKTKISNFNLLWEYLKNIQFALKIVGCYLLYMLVVVCGLILFIIPGVIFYYQFFMAFNLLADNPNLDILDALKQSRDLMKGHKFEFFLFQLSFIGHFLLLVVTLGIYGIYFLPYYYTAQTNYYLHLTKQNIFREESLEVIS
jgi:uncharacterized membrane protein